MREILADALHVFIIFMIAAFVIGGIMAVTGAFDHWEARYKLKRRRRRLMRNKHSQTEPPNPQAGNNRPYYSTNPNTETEQYKNKYAGENA